LAKTREFYRLFLAPGVGHCGGGPGPNEFGQAGGAGDAEHDLVIALERWVEEGVAPTRIIATKFNGDDPAKGVAMTRPLCPFPQAAKYLGSGDVADAKSFACADK
jgi:feruloyl esterase